MERTHLIVKILLLLLFPIIGFSQIEVQTNFNPAIAAPLDTRFSIPTLADTSTIVFPYLGLITWVVDIEQEWQYTGSWNRKPFGVADGDKTDVNVSSNGAVYIVEGIQSRPISPNFPSNGQVYAWNAAANEWQLSTPGGAADGVVTGGSVAGTTLTLTRSVGADVDIDVSSLVGGSGSHINRDTITQASHGFTIPTKGYIPVYLNSGTWTAASTTDSTTLHQAFIVGVLDVNTFVLQTTGLITVAAHGLTVGEDYFLQDNGSESITADATYNDWTVTVLSSETIDLKTVRPFGAIVGGGGGDGSETIVTAGANATVTGTGTSVDPYIIGATGGSSFWTQSGTDLTYTTGNVGIGVTPPTAALTVRGYGSTSATNAFNLKNSSGVDMMTIRDNGALSYGGAAFDAGYTYNLKAAPGLANIMRIKDQSNNIVFSIDQSGLYTIGGGSLTSAATNYEVNRFSRTWAPSTGGTTFGMFAINPTINQTGGANGISRGVYVNPTLTSAADYRGVETSNGTGHQFYANGIAPSLFNGPVKFQNGTAAIPALQGINDPNTGINFATNDVISIVTNGVERVTFGANGGLTLTTTTGKLNLPATNTAPATTGAQTINKISGSVNFAAAASALVVTNSTVSTSSLIFCQIMTDDSTAKSAVVTVASGSFTITLNAATTAETKVAFLVIN